MLVASVHTIYACAFLAATVVAGSTSGTSHEYVEADNAMVSSEADYVFTYVAVAVYHCRKHLPDIMSCPLNKVVDWHLTMHEMHIQLCSFPFASCSIGVPATHRLMFSATRD